MHLLGPCQPHLFEGVKIDLGIEEGGAEMAMSEYVGNRLQRMALLEHSGGKAMPKDMRPFAGELEVSRPDMTFHDSRKGAGMSQGVIGGSAGQKNMRVGIGRAGVS